MKLVHFQVIMSSRLDRNPWKSHKIAIFPAGIPQNDGREKRRFTKRHYRKQNLKKKKLFEHASVSEKVCGGLPNIRFDADSSSMLQTQIRSTFAHFRFGLLACLLLLLLIEYTVNVISIAIRRFG